MYKSFTSLVKLYSSVLCSFDAVINEIGFIISLLNSLLLICRNVTGFCLLILFSVTLNFCTSSKFLMVSWGFYI